MQTYANNLPVLTKVAGAYKSWHGFLGAVSRLSRYTLGTKIDELFVEIVELILIASYSPRQEKQRVTERAGQKLDLLKFFLQIAWELKVLDNKKYIALSTPLTEVGKMLGGWRKQVTHEAPAR